MQGSRNITNISGTKNQSSTSLNRKTATAQSRIQRLTLMLTEQCNLDCWMCDFARSKGLRKPLPMDIDAIEGLLKQRLFNKLQTITFTGGEPFMYPHVVPLFERLHTSWPRLQINFSSNATAIKPMLKVFSKVVSWDRVVLLTSVDGLSAHNEQRGNEDAFEKTTETLTRLRSAFPKLRIIVKFTVTQRNYHELEKTCRFIVEQGLTFTAKAIENNPFYTNKLNNLEDNQSYGFTPEQITDIRRQLDEIASYPRSLRKYLRNNEIRELHDSLNPDWYRTGKCQTPLKSAFIDPDLNLFTCKEFPPICNIADANLDNFENFPQFMETVLCEVENLGPCTKCTSQMKTPKRTWPWAKYIAPFRS